MADDIIIFAYKIFLPSSAVYGERIKRFYILMYYYYCTVDFKRVMRSCPIYSLHGKLQRFRELAVKMYRFSVTTRNVLAFIEHYTVRPLH